MGTVLDGVITCVGGKCVELALRKACYVLKVLARLRLYSEKLKKYFDVSIFSGHFCIQITEFSDHRYTNQFFGKKSETNHFRHITIIIHTEVESLASRLQIWNFLA